MVKKFELGDRVVINGFGTIADGTLGTVSQCDWEICKDMVCVDWDVSLKHLRHGHDKPNRYAVNSEYLSPIKELGGFKVGGKVVLTCERRADQTYFKKHGVVCNKTVLTISDLDDCYLYFFGDTCDAVDGWRPTNFKHYVEPVEVDLHVYPDTPVGTVLVVTEDTITKQGHFVHKGTEVILSHREYSIDGAFRFCTLPRGVDKYIDCDVLMIKG